MRAPAPAGSARWCNVCRRLPHTCKKGRLGGGIALGLRFVLDRNPLNGGPHNCSLRLENTASLSILVLGASALCALPQRCRNVTLKVAAETIRRKKMHLSKPWVTGRAKN